MKILFISYKFHPDIGGIEVNSEILARHFVNFGAEVHLITKTKQESDIKFPFEVIRNPAASILKKEIAWADVVFENNPSLNLSWAILFTRVKHVIALRTWISRTNGKISLIDILKKKWVKRADAVIAVSEAVKELTFKKAIVIGNPYRSNLFRNLNKERTLDFAFLGRLVSDKGADMAIALIKLLNENHEKKFTLTVIGDGEEKEKLRYAVEENNLQKYVFFVGVKIGEDLVEILNNHKYLLAPSKWREPFGNVALEGMACGCLPIVSDGGGLVDAVGNAGLVFRRNDLQDMFEVVDDLITNPEKEEALRGNFEVHLEKHKPEFVSSQYFNVINAVVTK